MIANMPSTKASGPSCGLVPDWDIAKGPWEEIVVVLIAAYGLH